MKRQELLDALGTVPGLAPSPTTPAPIIAGSAWPVWRGSALTTGCVVSEQWEVWVAVPAADQWTSADASDQIRDEVALALMQVGDVIGWFSDAWPLEPGGQSMPCIRYDMEV